MPKDLEMNTALKPLIVPLTTTRVLTLVQGTSGLWHLTDSAGMMGGTFRDLRAALYMLRLELGRPVVVVEGIGQRTP